MKPSFKPVLSKLKSSQTINGTSVGIKFASNGFVIESNISKTSGCPLAKATFFSKVLGSFESVSDKKFSLLEIEILNN